MLHGLFGSSDNWLGVAPKLAQKFHVYLLDLRNHGQSPHSDEMDYPIMAKDVLEFFDAHNLNRANLLGHSMGGKVAMELALNFPARVQKLVVVDMATRTNPQEHEKYFKALLALDLKKFQSRTQIEDALAPEIPDLALRRFLLKNLRLISSASSSLVFEWRIPLRKIFANYPQLCDALPPRASFPGPTLFLRGGRSHYILESDTPRIRELFPRAEILTIADAGHWVHADAPEEFVRLIQAFLESDDRS